MNKWFVIINPASGNNFVKKIKLSILEKDCRKHRTTIKNFSSN